ncbi:polysaccharide biosynthesis tyrosine autokinase [uncultured Psychrosphaera sp.]|uniref:GumC family protein n=1 Tax=uncultured Psychrosphaera sp. TaxID=1403522 RepID=UPI00262685EE|nr:polysaccharide biosynthesis tyrosine autokinase [uncultured Psychrosphaera sp.]
MSDPVVLPTKANEEVLDLRQYWKVINKSKFKILSFAMAITLFTIVVVMSITPSYQSTATLLIEAEAAKAVSIEDVYGINSAQKEYFLTQFEILKSKSLSEKVIKDMSLKDKIEFAGDPSSFSLKGWIKSVLGLSNSGDVLSEEDIERIKNHQILDVFVKKLSISPIRKTQLVNITFESEDPKLAADIANTLGETYIQNYITSKNNVTKKAEVWLNSRLEGLEENLRLSEDELQNFITENELTVINGVAEITGERLQALQKRLIEEEQIKAQINSVNEIFKSNGAKDISELAGLEIIASNKTVQDFKQDQIAVQRKLSDLGQVYGPKHPKMYSAKAELVAINDRINAEIINLAENSEKLLTAANTRIKNIKSDIEATRIEHQHNLKLENKYIRFKRQVSTNRKLYDTFIERAKETSITSDFESAHARFTDRASIPILPSKPKKGLIVVLAFIASLAVGVVFVFVIDALNDSFRTTEEIENKLGQRLLGLIPLVKHDKDKDLSLHCFYKKDQRAFSESIRTLRTSFTLTNIDKAQQVIQVTSSQPNEGKTTTSINIAFAMAQMESVLLIDADMRRPSICKLFGLPAYHPGLANLIAGTEKLEDCIYKDEQSGIDVLTAGMIPPNPLELLSSPKFVELLADFRTKYDRIVIDMAPTQAVSDALVVSKYVDSLIYIIRADYTRQKVAKNGIGRLLEVNAKLAGVVLNYVDVSKKENYEGYHGYYDYYAYNSDETN